MKSYEHEADIFSASGIRVPEGILVSSSDEDIPAGEKSISPSL
jgi:hypothetical protein